MKMQTYDKVISSTKQLLIVRIDMIQVGEVAVWLLPVLTSKLQGIEATSLATTGAFVILLQCRRRIRQDPRRQNRKGQDDVLHHV